jgi:hypothetical protein
MNIKDFSSTEVQQLAIDIAAQYMFDNEDYTLLTAKQLVDAIYKVRCEGTPDKFYNSFKQEEPFKSLFTDAVYYARCQALIKKAEFAGYHGDAFVWGVLGAKLQDYIGCVENEKERKLIEQSFATGKKWAEHHNFRWDK